MGPPTDGLVRQLQHFRSKIQARYKVERMILFGSRARGKTHRFSDVDLIVVSPHFRRKNIVARASPLYLEWDRDFPVDFVCDTPEECAALCRRPGVGKGALLDGVTIRASGLR